MAGEFLIFFLDPGADGFDDALEAAKDAGAEAVRSTRQVANDAAGIMAQVVTKDTWDLANKMGIQKSDVSSNGERYEVGSNALNRSDREYAFFEHMRHEGHSFFDVGEQYANDALWEGSVKIINSID